MIIQKCATFTATDTAKYAWTRLKHFQNIDAVALQIMSLHGLPERHRPNAKRQAAQLRQCLMQAGEYFEAAKAVSLATRPVLLYYSIMSLALCEVLLKQTADSRLEKLRERHGCHGLQLSIASLLDASTPLHEAAAALKAKPQTAPDGSARGTFEVWRRSSRETPVCGIYSQPTPDGTGTTSGYRVLMIGADHEPEAFPTAGYSLFDVLVGLPQMAEFLPLYNFPAHLARATCSAQWVPEQESAIIRLVIHPTLTKLLDDFSHLVAFAPRGAHRLVVREFPSGFLLEFPWGQDAPGSLPWSISPNTSNTWFSTRRESLNEFGLLYVGLHIAGNFARYYPDKWLAHIEASSPLALAIDKLTEIAMDRAPLLTLSELTRSYFVPEA
ncbi:YaaC family protein [Cupriavidus sp. YAF13]|uniref:YaaC family protein n=1 Tax=Cupriavidus sp. YAF13 TaxID=3233075 RepID=UPI003F9179AD